MTKLGIVEDEVEDAEEDGKVIEFLFDLDAEVI